MLKNSFDLCNCLSLYAMVIALSPQHKLSINNEKPQNHLLSVCLPYRREDNYFQIPSLFLFATGNYYFTDTFPRVIITNTQFLQFKQILRNNNNKRKKLPRNSEDTNIIKHKNSNLHVNCLLLLDINLCS